MDMDGARPRRTRRVKQAYLQYRFTDTFVQERVKLQTELQHNGSVNAVLNWV